MHRPISTHTLTWSVTVIIIMALVNLIDFNSHAHVERDSMVSASSGLKKHFNSHAHVERDFLTASGTWLVNHFNSHAHVERDP